MRSQDFLELKQLLLSLKLTNKVITRYASWVVRGRGLCFWSTRSAWQCLPLPWHFPAPLSWAVPPAARFVCWHGGPCVPPVFPCVSLCSPCVPHVFPCVPHVLPCAGHGCSHPDEDVEAKLKPVQFATSAVHDLLDDGNAITPLLLFDSSIVPLVDGETICDVVTQVRALCWLATLVAVACRVPRVLAVEGVCMPVCCVGGWCPPPTYHADVACPGVAGAVNPTMCQPEIHTWLTWMESCFPWKRTMQSAIILTDRRIVMLYQRGRFGPKWDVRGASAPHPWLLPPPPPPPARKDSLLKLVVVGAAVLCALLRRAATAHAARGRLPDSTPLLLGGPLALLVAAPVCASARVHVCAAAAWSVDTKVLLRVFAVVCWCARARTTTPSIPSSSRYARAGAGVLRYLFLSVAALFCTKSPTVAVPWRWCSFVSCCPCALRRASTK